MSYGINSPNGLQPLYSGSSATYSGMTNKYTIASGYATSLFTGDPVVGLNNGNIGIGVTSTGILGVFQGCEYTNTSGSVIFQSYWPANTVVLANTTVTAFVLDDPNMRFNIQVSNSTNADFIGLQAGISLTNQNLNASFAVGGGPAAPTAPYTPNPTGGSTVTGQSAYYLDFATINTTATLSLKILGLVPTINPNNIYFVQSAIPFSGQFNNVVVVINNHVLKGGTGTAGV